MYQYSTNTYTYTEYIPKWLGNTVCQLSISLCISSLIESLFFHLSLYTIEAFKKAPKFTIKWKSYQFKNHFWMLCIWHFLIKISFLISNLENVKANQFLYHRKIYYFLSRNLDYIKGSMLSPNRVVVLIYPCDWK